MQRFRFRKGLRFLQGSRQWTLLRELPTHKVQLQDEEGQLLAMPKNDLVNLWQKKDWRIDDSCLDEIDDVIYTAAPKDLDTYSAKVRATGTRRARYATALVGPGFRASQDYVKGRISAIAAEIGDPSPPHPTSVLRWIRKMGPSKDPCKLIDRRGRPGRPENARGYAFFERAVDTVFVTPQKMPGRAVTEQVCRDILAFNRTAPEEEQVKVPSRATIYRWLGELNHYLVDAGREGKRAANIEYRSVEGTVEIANILERVEIDHTPLDLILIDEVTQVSLGRPWLTLAIDRFSRAILGFYLSFNPPSSNSVMQCLKHCVLPKASWMEGLGKFTNAWPMHGLPMKVVFDNGMDLHSDAVEKICLEMGIQVQFCPPAQPYLKGAIERAFGTLARDLIHRLPGTTFSNVKQRGDYPSEANATLTLPQATLLLTKWIVDVYHQRRHRSTQRTPHELWVQQLAHTTIEFPAHPEKLEVLVGIPAKRQRISQEGIQFDTLLYNNEDLQDLRRRLGGRTAVEFKFFEDDTSYIQVWDRQSGHYIRVDVVEKFKAYARGLSRQLHLVTRRWAEKTHGEDWKDEHLLSARAEIEDMVSQASRDKKMAIRKKAAAARGVDSRHQEARHQALDRALLPRAQPTAFPPGFASVAKAKTLPTFTTHRAHPRGGLPQGGEERGGQK